MGRALQDQDGRTTTDDHARRTRTGNPENPHPFQGNVDLAKLDRLVQGVGADRIPYISLEMVYEPDYLRFFQAQFEILTRITGRAASTNMAAKKDAG